LDIYGGSEWMDLLPQGLVKDTNYTKTGFYYKLKLNKIKKVKGGNNDSLLMHSADG